MGICILSNECECLTSSRSRESSLSVEGIVCNLDLVQPEWVLRGMTSEKRAYIRRVFVQLADVQQVVVRVVFKGGTTSATQRTGV
jgi:hypothetical protein